MKQLIIILISIFSLTSCDVLEEAADILTTETVGSSTPSLSNDEAISGLKEALNIGITNAVYLTSEN